MRKLSLFKSVFAGAVLFFCLSTVNGQSMAALSGSQDGFTITGKSVQGNSEVFTLHSAKISQSFAQVLEDADSYISIKLDQLIGSYNLDVANQTLVVTTSATRRVNDETIVQVMNMLMESASKGLQPKTQQDVH